MRLGAVTSGNCTCTVALVERARLKSDEGGKSCKLILPHGRHRGVARPSALQMDTQACPRAPEIEIDSDACVYRSLRRPTR